MTPVTLSSSEVSPQMTSTVDVISQMTQTLERTSNMTLVPPLTLTWLNITTGLAEFLLMFVIVGGNTLVIVGFCVQHQLHCISNYLLLQLAVADLLVGLSLIYQAVCMFHKHMVQNIYLCVMRYVTAIAPLNASIMCLLCLTVDRYIAITRPLRYHSLVDMTSLRIMSLIIWLTTLLLGVSLPVIMHYDWEYWPHYPRRRCELIYVLRREYMQYIMMPAFSLAVCAMVVMYMHIYAIAVQAARSQQTQDLVRQPNDQPPPGPRHHDLSAEMKVVKTMLLVLGTFIFCWLPFFFILLAQLLGNLSDNLSNFRTLATLLTFLNSAADPFIYVIRIPLLRHKIQTLVCPHNTVHPTPNSINLH